MQNGSRRDIVWRKEESRDTGISANCSAVQRCSGRLPAAGSQSVGGFGGVRPLLFPPIQAQVALQQLGFLPHALPLLGLLSTYGPRTLPAGSTATPPMTGYQVPQFPPAPSLPQGDRTRPLGQMSQDPRLRKGVGPKQGAGPQTRLGPSAAQELPLVDWSGYQTPSRLFAPPVKAQPICGVEPPTGAGSGGETAASILAKVGLSSQDLELLSRCPDEQLTPDTLPLILRTMGMLKAKHSLPSPASSPAPDPGPATHHPPDYRPVGKPLSREQGLRKGSAPKCCPPVESLESGMRSSQAPAVATKRPSHDGHRHLATPTNRDHTPMITRSPIWAAEKPARELHPQPSKQPPRPVYPLRKPTPTMVNDYMPAPPRLFPHTFSLCSQLCACTPDWLEHQNTARHIESSGILRKKYSFWSPNPRCSSREEDRPARSPSRSVSRSLSWSPSPPPVGRGRGQRSGPRSPQRGHRRRAGSPCSFKPRPDKLYRRSPTLPHSPHRPTSCSRPQPCPSSAERFAKKLLPATGLSSDGNRSTKSRSSCTSCSPSSSSLCSSSARCRSSTATKPSSSIGSTAAPPTSSVVNGTSDPKKCVVLITGLPELGCSKEDLSRLAMPFGVPSEVIIASEQRKALVQLRDMSMAEQMVKVYSCLPVRLGGCELSMRVLHQSTDTQSPALGEADEACDAVDFDLSGDEFVTVDVVGEVVEECLMGCSPAPPSPAPPTGAQTPPPDPEWREAGETLVTLDEVGRVDGHMLLLSVMEEEEGPEHKPNPFVPEEGGTEQTEEEEGEIKSPRTAPPAAPAESPESCGGGGPGYMELVTVDQVGEVEEQHGEEDEGADGKRKGEEGEILTERVEVMTQHTSRGRCLQGRDDQGKGRCEYRMQKSLRTEQGVGQRAGQGAGQRTEQGAGQVACSAPLFPHDFQMPPFSPDSPIGMNFLVPKTGFFCRLCSMFYSGDKAAERRHCCSLKHYHNMEKFLQRWRAKQTSSTPPH